ncbi:hypothetical protein [Aporhodopirellula aestuarii]|uniref:Uncharacterized protein n=1 Tax=Aporhodopirellula aestuarii TaxID=2950107 RepID=A0ABT0U4R1_9BACT|nr:hypothetical protein [Aporhodopirellula aestuarii]MCM2371892.1 hypothetical protein [Aporhodopirellula aestuarii]
MKFRIADLLHLTFMVGSLLVMWRSPEVFLWLVVLVSSLFAVPVSHECLRLIAAGNITGAELLNALQPRIRVWVVLWLFYFAALEVFLAFVWGGLSVMVSAVLLGWMSSLVTLKVLLAPRVRRMWALLPLV